MTFIQNDSMPFDAMQNMFGCVVSIFMPDDIVCGEYNVCVDVIGHFSTSLSVICFIFEFVPCFLVAFLLPLPNQCNWRYSREYEKVLRVKE